MTPIGHFMCASAVAGNAGLLEEKETNLCFAYYGFFFLRSRFSPKFCIQADGLCIFMTSSATPLLFFFLFFWGGKDRRRQLFVCLLIGGQILSAYTHMFDVIYLKFAGYIRKGCGGHITSCILLWLRS